MDWSFFNIMWSIIGDWLSSLLGVKETGGYDWIRHGLQLVVGVVAVWLTAVVFGKMRAGKTAA